MVLLFICVSYTYLFASNEKYRRSTENEANNHIHRKSELGGYILDDDKWCLR